jgi:hypothetical protein
MIACSPPRTKISVEEQGIPDAVFARPASGMLPPHQVVGPSSKEPHLRMLSPPLTEMKHPQMIKHVYENV